VSEREAFLRAIRENPADDTARLVFADWLQEHGEPERAEFIRLQIELAGLEAAERARFNEETDWRACTGIAATWCPNCGECSCPNREESMDDPGCPLHSADSPHCCLDNLAYRRERLREREAELFNADWLPPCDGQLREWYFTRFPANHAPERPFSFVVRRGFVAKVGLAWDDFVKYAPSVFAAHPIEAVLLTDCPVWPSGGNDTYYLGGLGRFPKEYWSLLDGHRTPAGVLAAASAVCLDYGRRAAKALEES
jgi:uncharacterized protein (TIGR02996 family)